MRQHVARERFVGAQLHLRALRQVIVQRFMKSCLQLILTATVKANNAANACQVPDKNAVSPIKLERALQAL